MWGWQVASRDQLHARLKAVPGNVPPRGVGRKYDHAENYVMRDLAWTLANTTTLFTYPLSIAKGQSPDFDVQIAGQAIGVEVTDAIPNSFAKAIVEQNREYRDQGRAYAISCSESGDDAERQWAEVIANAVDKKLGKLNDPHWRRQDQNWLAVHDVAPQAVGDLGLACFYLHERLAALPHHDVNFDRVFVERPIRGNGDTILMVTTERVRAHQP